MRIAVVGSGIAGLAAAWALAHDPDRDGIQEIEVVLYEANDRLGGHTNTYTIPGDPPVQVDTGFIVFNPNTYPNLIAMFKHLGVQYQDSSMSFSVSIDDGKVEWAGESLWTIFGQKKNLLSSDFWRMLIDMYHFNKHAPQILDNPNHPDAKLTLGEYLSAKGYSTAFVDLYLLPMTSAVWSTPKTKMLEFPILTLVRFLFNHSMVDFTGRPTWLTVSNGSRSYINKILIDAPSLICKTGCKVVGVSRSGDFVEVVDEFNKVDHFDKIILACHGDQALQLLSDADEREHSVLQHFTNKSNLAVLHTDESLMPHMKSLWSSWNYFASSTNKDTDISLTYWMNRLQPFIPKEQNYFVTVNPHKPPAKEKVIAEIPYEHPVYTQSTVKSQQALKELQGHRNIYYAGAWTNFGFHEDGATSGLRAAEMLGARIPFKIRDASNIRKEGFKNKL